MKFQPDRSDAQTISGYGPGWVAVHSNAQGVEKIHRSCLLGADGLRQDWGGACFDELGAADFAQLATLDVEIIIFGSGGRIRFPKPAWLAPLMARRIGLETMDTGAACRTYNFLAHEGRRVALALLIEPAQAA